MRVAVSGAQGWIGGWLCRRLRGDGHEVHACDLVAGHDCEKVDVVDGAAVMRWMDSFETDVVCHLAAQFDVGVSWQAPVRDAAVNIMGTLNVHRAAEANGVRRMVFPSTGLVYGSAPGRYLRHDVLRPESPYAVAKAAASQYLMVMGERVPATVLVLGNVVGPGGDNVVSTFARMAVRGQVPKTVAPVARDFVYVDDVIEAMVASMEMTGTETLHVGTGVATSLEEVWSLCQDSDPKPVDPAGAAVLDCERTSTILGWEPTRTVADVVREVLAYEKTLYQGVLQ